MARAAADDQLDRQQGNGRNGLPQSFSAGSGRPRGRPGEILAHGREVAIDQGVVEADDANVLWNTHPTLAQGADDADRHLVTRGNHGIKGNPELERPKRGHPGGVPVELARDLHHAGAMILQPVLQPRHPHADFRVRRIPNEEHAGTTDAHQVHCNQRAACTIVAAEKRYAVVKSGLRRAPHHHRDTELAEMLRRRIVSALAEDHDAVDVQRGMALHLGSNGEDQR